MKEHAQMPWKVGTQSGSKLASTHSITSCSRTPRALPAALYKRDPGKEYLGRTQRMVHTVLLLQQHQVGLLKVYKNSELK